MRTDRILCGLAGLTLLLAQTSTLRAADTAAAAVTCEVAVPSECDPPGVDGAKPVRQPRTVKSLPATSEAECLDLSRAVTSACLRSQQGKADVTARFLKGPVETIRQITPSAKPRVRSDTVGLPIVYGEDFETEIDQHGYSPRFAPGVVNFNNDGLMRIRHRNYLQAQTRGGEWVFTDLAAAATEAIRRLPDVASFEWVWDDRSPYRDHRIYFDARGRAYTLLQGGRTRLKGGNALSHRPYLLVSNDDGSRWAAATIPVPHERPTWTVRLEHNDGNNDRRGPPPLLLNDLQADANKRSPCLYLYVPRWHGDELTVPPAVLVSEKSLLHANHSGAANSMVSTADRIYIVYPGSQIVPGMQGTPAYMVVFNKEHAAIEGETLIGFGGAATSVDKHNVPGACIGTQQTIHVLMPGHQEALRLRTGKINGAGTAWAPHEALGEAPNSSGYTYGSLNCDRAGNVYVTSRWAGDHYRFQLVFLHRKPDGQWIQWDGEPHKVLVDPGRSFYGSWRQHVTVDNEGRLFLSYSYYANQLTEDGFAKLKWRFPFQNWTEVRERASSPCMKGRHSRCWRHPMPEVTSVVLKSGDLGESWSFVE